MDIDLSHFFNKNEILARFYPSIHYFKFQSNFQTCNRDYEENYGFNCEINEETGLGVCYEKGEWEEGSIKIVSRERTLGKKQCDTIKGLEEKNFKSPPLSIAYNIARLYFIP